MSSITKILAEKDVTSEDKLAGIAEIVAVARKAYGNEDEKISCPEVNTTHGVMDFVHLEADAKVSLLSGEIQRIKAQAIEFCKQNEGSVMNKKIEELLATNGLFVNVSAGTKFDYI